MVSFSIGVVLGVFALAAIPLAVWLVMQSARGTHHKRNRRAGRQLHRDHAVPAGDRCTQPPPAALFIARSDGRAHRFDLTTSPVRVGRDSDNDLVIPEGIPLRDTVSRRHAWMYYDTRLGHWIVEDPGSQNGTYVDGERTGHNILQDGTRVAFGGVQALFREME